MSFFKYFKYTTYLLYFWNNLMQVHWTLVSQLKHAISIYIKRNIYLYEML